MAALGAWLAASSAQTAPLVLGAWLIGAGLNYAPLAAYAVALSRPGALDSELAGVDPARELRRYTAAQLCIFIPLSLVVAALITRAKR